MTGECARSYRIGDGVIYQKLQDEAVILEMNSQMYYGLDSVATEMWELLLNQNDFDAVVDRMGAAYDVDTATLRSDLERLIETLTSARLLSPASA